MPDPAKVARYSDKILEIIEHQDLFTTGDLQGAVEAIVINIILEAEAAQRMANNIPKQ